MNFFDPGLAPFTIALLLMAFILAFELASALFGAPASELLDNALPDLDADAPDADPGPLGGLLSWLYVGRAPLLILLAAFLVAFGLTGLILQTVLKNIFGFHLWSWLAVVPAVAVALPFVRVVGRFFSRVLRQEESDAVSRQTFIGKVAVVVRGEARRGFPAEAKLRDLTGTTHYVLVEPDEDDGVFSSGSEVLLVEQAGAVFRAIINPSRALSAG
ncbi:MAG TPA: YqiJ family protein [Hyphomonadaceae bacterium]|nr:YqiJ family protein [Hyphomonadaceae bacterium]